MTFAAKRRAVLIDKDGTLLVDVPYNVDPARMRLAPGAAAGLRRLGRLGLPLVVVSNQPGVALGRITLDELGGVFARLSELFQRCGAKLTDFYYCPHHPSGTIDAYRFACTCRKPMPGMLSRAAADHRIDLHASWMIGDILDDVEAGRRAGCRTVLVDNGNETEWLVDPTVPMRRIPHHCVRDFDDAATLVARQANPALASGSSLRRPGGR